MRPTSKIIYQWSIAIANPLTLIVFVAIQPGFGVVFHENSVLSLSEFVAGVFLVLPSGGSFSVVQLLVYVPGSMVSTRGRSTGYPA
ncbi:MAG: hypothetical protein WCH85_11205 [Methanomicrobiales archaeon]